MGESQALDLLHNTAVSEAQPARPLATPAARKGCAVPGFVTALAMYAAFRLCSGIIGGVWQTVSQFPAENERIASVLDQVVRSGNARDANAIYAQFSTEARPDMPLSEIEQWVGGYNYVLFSGYRELAISEINLNWSETTTAEVSGTIAYDDGCSGSIAAVLVKEDGTWKLNAINVSVPPGKFGAFR